MVYLLFKFNKKELSTYNLVFKHLRFWFFSLMATPFIFLFSSYFALFKYKSLSSGIVTAISCLALFAICYFGANRKAKFVVKKIYNVSSNDFEWNSPKVLMALRKYEKEQLLNQLKEIDPCSDVNDIKELAEVALNESEKIKTKFPVIPSFFAALFISMWNNFFNWVYKNDDIKTLNDAVIILLVTALLLAAFIGFYIMISSFYHMVKEDIFNKAQKKMRTFSEILNEICKDKEKEKRKKLLNS